MDRLGLHPCAAYHVQWRGETVPHCFPRVSVERSLDRSFRRTTELTAFDRTQVCECAVSDAFQSREVPVST